MDAISSAGAYTCTVTVSDPNADNSPQTASVTYTVSPVVQPDTSAPTVGITSPSNGAKVKQNGNTNIKANATDNIGVSKVEFYVNGALQCTDNTTPYVCAWKVPKGSGVSYQLQAKAYDVAGNMGASAIVTVSSK